MKRVFKKIKSLIPATFLSLIVSFMIFIYEPVTMYANNLDDFWFDFYTLIGPSFLFFTATFFALFIFFLIIKLIAKWINHPNLYYIILSFASACFFCAYIHSNFLTSFLPPLDGTTFNWNNPTANIISIVICLVLFSLLIFSFIKAKPRKTTKYCFYLVSAIFAILIISFSSTLFTTDVFEPKEIITNSTIKNLNLLSNNENFLILLVDAVDSTHFNNIVKNNQKYQKDLKDFSYFPDTLSSYSFTRDAIPSIFSGEWNENQVQFPEYSTKAYDNSKFFARLSEKNYNKNFYSYDFTWNSAKALEFDNIVSSEKNPKRLVLLKEETKYFLYKALPFPLKKFSRIETLNFSAAQTTQDYDSFNWSNINFYNNYLKQPISKTNQNYFQFIHIEGGHVPFNNSKDVTLLPEENGTYEEKLEATMKIIEAYLSRLKENNAYDNATIVLLADHGFWHNGTNRANPILYIKGKHETHDQMFISNKQISYADLCEAFTELLDNKSSTEIFKDIPTEGRIRRFINNSFNHEEHMEEYEQTDKAWNTKTLTPTGKEYDL